ncbi:MAG: hypothetical protein V4722_04445 [Bacteroidota bacterium]
MTDQDTIQVLQQLVAQQASELEQLRSELKLYKPRVVVTASGKMKGAHQVSAAERDMRIAAIQFVAKLPMFSRLQHNPTLKLARYLATCEANNKIDTAITINHFK